MMGNLSIRQKLFGLVAVQIVGMLAAALFGGARIAALHGELVAAQERHHEMVGAVESVVSAQVHFKTQIQEWKNILLRGKDEAAYDKHLKGFNEEADKALKELDDVTHHIDKLGLAGEIRVAETITVFKTLTPAYLEALAPYRGIVADGGDAAGTVDKAVKGKDRDPAKALNDLVEKIQKAGEAATVQERERADAISASARNSMIVMIVLILAICIGLALFIVNSITRPVSALEGTMSEISRTNNLTLRAEVIHQDEIGRMAQVFNAMVEKLQSLVSHVGHASHEVTRASNELTSSMSVLSDAIDQQSGTVSSSAASIEELTVSISTVADTASSVSEQSAQSVRNTTDGNAKVSELVGEIRAIQANVSQIANSVEEFVKSTSAITGMTKEVREIADQTNLLALNAAIEAARAGEQGRGFAVVADEVRKLAEKSGSSAGEIDGVAQAIINQSGQVHKSIEAGLRSIEASARLAVDVEATLNQARELVERSGKGVEEIAWSVKEQKTASTDIAKNMEHISGAAEEAAQTARSVNGTAVELKRAAGELDEAIAGFRV